MTSASCPFHCSIILVHTAATWPQNFKYLFLRSCGTYRPVISNSVPPVGHNTFSYTILARENKEFSPNNLQLSCIQKMQYSHSTASSHYKLWTVSQINTKSLLSAKFFLLQEAMFRMQACKIADRLLTAADSFHMMHFGDVSFLKWNKQKYACLLFMLLFVWFEAAESERRMKCQQSHTHCAMFVD